MYTTLYRTLSGGRINIPRRESQDKYENRTNDGASAGTWFPRGLPDLINNRHFLRVCILSPCSFFIVHFSGAPLAHARVRSRVSSGFIPPRTMGFIKY